MVAVEKQAFSLRSKMTFFFHNSLHELESTWILFFHYPVGTRRRSLNAQKAAINGLFPRVLQNDRSFLMRVPMKFKLTVESLRDDFRPYGGKLDDLRASLEEAYRNFEACLVEESSIKHIKKVHETHWMAYTTPSYWCFKKWRRMFN